MTDYVAGREADVGDGARTGSDGAPPTPGLAHAVERSQADGPPPWHAVCGAPVAVIRGAWTGPRGLGSGAPCPACASQVPG